MHRAIERHAALLHRLEQRGLGLGRGAIDLVGEHQVMEDRPARQRELAEAQAALGAVTLADPLVDYIVQLVRGTRDSADLVAGASPRAAVLLASAARARAALAGRDYVIPDDVKALATAVLRHRMVLSPAAEIDGRQAEVIVADLVQRTEAPR